MSEWISVKEKLPEIDPKGYSSENVLVYDSEGFLVACVNFYPARGCRKEDLYTWSEQCTGCGCCARSLNPTHWMPLPVPPKECHE
jgi:hypothetical protein